MQDLFKEGLPIPGACTAAALNRGVQVLQSTRDDIRGTFVKRQLKIDNVVCARNIS